MIKIGNALDVLKTMDAESVHSCVTSPPFWGLRVYGTEPQIWDGDEKCVHEWGDGAPKGGRIKRDEDYDPKYPQPQRDLGSFSDGIRSHTCIHCDAWCGELGSEKTPEDFIRHLCDIFDEVKRVLRKDGVVFCNISDSYSGSWGNSGSRPELDDKPGEQREKNTEYYSRKGWDNRRDRPPSSYKVNGLKPKDLCLIPQRLAIELQCRGWWVRSMFQWWKASAMPESCKDRPSNSHEWVLMLTRSKSYWYDIDVERVSGSKRSNGQSRAGETGVFGGEKGRNYNPTKGDPNYRGGNEQWGRAYTLGNSRNLRSGDFMQMSLDAEIEHARNYLKSLHDIKRKGGIITDDEGTPVGLFCNPKGLSLKHFASFPPRFAEILINLSVPAKCCAVCGKGWKRVKRVKRVKQESIRKRDEGNQYNYGGERWDTTVKTLGFRPDCNHYDDNYRNDFPKAKSMRKRYQRAISGNWFKRARLQSGKSTWLTAPGTVLDPFLGSGTTALVAQRLGRQWVGIELSEEYATMAQKRLEDENQLEIF